MLWGAWFALASIVVLFAVALPWAARIAICAGLVVPGICGVRRFVLLEGQKAVRAIEWTEEGEFAVWLGPNRIRHASSLGTGSFRLGLRLWVLRFVTPLGVCPVLVVGGVQDSLAFRRLSRCLNRCLRRASGRYTRPAVTIRPKV